MEINQKSLSPPANVILKNFKFYPWLWSR